MAKSDYRKDKKFYAEIWEEREHRSEISDEPLGEEPNTWFFAHIIPKGSYPRFRHRKDNIVLMTQREHTLYDHQTHKARADERFDWLFEKADQLRAEYNNA